MAHRLTSLGNDEDRTAYGGIPFFCGLAHGFAFLLHPNGQVGAAGVFSGGVPKGAWRFYDEEGTLIAEGNQKSQRSWKYYAGFDEASFIAWMERWRRPIWMTVDEGMETRVGFFGLGPPVWYARREKIYDDYYPFTLVWEGVD